MCPKNQNFKSWALTKQNASKKNGGHLKKKCGFGSLHFFYKKVWAVYLIEILISNFGNANLIHSVCWEANTIGQITLNWEEISMNEIQEREKRKETVPGVSLCSKKNTPIWNSSNPQEKSQKIRFTAASGTKKKHNTLGLGFRHLDWHVQPDAQGEIDE